ncbi:MAG: hypothetical protein LBQ49_02030, partial [Rickettsiales bacterium]|nr:hypothetical protein [Rickettsiales bacterium]
METRSLLFAVCCLLCVDPAFALALDAALVSADKNCGGVYEEIGRLKKMAGINTVVTGIGTAAGVGAVATGFAGSRKMDRLLAKLKEAEKENPARPTREELEELNADIEALYA